MKVAIFGGSGFIGTALCKKFVKLNIDKFSILDIKSSYDFPERFQKCDVVNQINLDISPDSFDAIVNLAAEHRDNVSPISLYETVNIDGAINVCKFARDNRINKIVFTSSVAVYGFAESEVSESSPINPFNEYGRTKWAAEKIYSEWYREDPENRVLVVIRPTVVFGEKNRGNVFNLFEKIHSGKFFMIGNGVNKKSMAYVENVADFIYHCLRLDYGKNIYNYVDKPDFTMNDLVSLVSSTLKASRRVKVRLPYLFGIIIGSLFDLVAYATGSKFTVSAIRIKKFCSNSVYSSAVSQTGFTPSVDLREAIVRTLNYEFLESTSRTANQFHSE